MTLLLVPFLRSTPEPPEPSNHTHTSQSTAKIKEMS